MDNHSLSLTSSRHHQNQVRYRPPSETQSQTRSQKHHDSFDPNFSRQSSLVIDQRPNDHLSQDPEEESEVPDEHDNPPLKRQAKISRHSSNDSSNQEGAFQPPSIKYKPSNLQFKMYDEYLNRNHIAQDRFALENDSHDPNSALKEKYWQSEVLSARANPNFDSSNKPSKTQSVIRELTEETDGVTQKPEPSAATDQDSIPEAHLIVFSGGDFFQRQEKPIQLISEEQITNQFQAFYNDLLPFLISHFRNTSSLESQLNDDMVLVLKDTQKDSSSKGFSRQKAGSIAKQQTKSYITYKSVFNLRTIFENHLHAKFKIIQALPLTEKSSVEAEYYLIEEIKTSDILLVKIFPYTFSINDPSRHVLLALHFKIAEKTLSKLIDQHAKSQVPMPLPLLRTLFYDVLTVGHELQGMAITNFAFHPDFIFYNSVSQMFQVLPFAVVNPTQTTTDRQQTGLSPNSKAFDELQDQSMVRKLPSQTKTYLCGHPDYFSPLQRAAYAAGTREVRHNPYKSAVFSLGLILYEAFTLMSASKLVSSRRQLSLGITRHPLVLTSSAIGSDYFLKAPNVFELLLVYEEEHRYDFFNLFFYTYVDLPSINDPLYAPATSWKLENEVAKASGAIMNKSIVLYDEIGAKYSGSLLTKARHGPGSFFDAADNVIFKGLWEDNFPKEGVYYYGAGYRYEGSFNGPLHEGKGILFYKDLPIFRGEWRDFKYHGRGQLYFEGSEKVYYEGEFKLGLKHGLGQLYYPNGNLRYSGTFKQGRIHERGSLFWPSGAIKFEGEIYSESLEEVFLKGTYYTETQSGIKDEHYVGELYNEKYHGSGALYGRDGKMINTGEWLNGELVRSVPASFDLSELRRSTFKSIKKTHDTRTYLSGELVFSVENSTTKEFRVYVDFHTKCELKVSLMGLQNTSLSQAFEVLTHNPYLRRINHLVLSKFNFDKPEQTLRALLESYNLKDLRKLWIVECLHLSDALLAVFGEGRCLVGLEELVLDSAGRFTNEGLRTLFNSAFLSNLKRFAMRRPLGLVDKHTTEHLNNSLYLNNLRSLSLAQSNLRASSVKTIFNSQDSFTALKNLNLSYNKLSSRACKHIMEATTDSIHLEKLSLKSCGVEAKGVFYLANSPILSQLRNLNLAYNEIGNTGCEAIASTEILTGLERLGLNGCSVAAGGLDALCEIERPKKLQKLELSYNPDLDDSTMEILANAIPLGNLQSLFLEGTSVSIEGLRTVCGSFRLRNLTSIKIFGREVGKQVTSQLRTELELPDELLIE